MTLLDLFRFLVEGIALLDLVLIEDYAAFLAGHCLDQTRPFGFCQTFVASETSPKTDIPDVPFGVVFGGRCPSRNDVPDAVQFVLCGVGMEQHKSGSKAIFDGFEADKQPPSISPQGGSALGEFAFPMGARHFADVQGVVVTFS